MPPGVEPTVLDWLEPLRHYPRWLVLGCAAVIGAGTLLLFARLIKWCLYVALAIGLIAGLTALAWWLKS